MTIYEYREQRIADPLTSAYLTERSLGLYNSRTKQAIWMIVFPEETLYLIRDRLTGQDRMRWNTVMLGNNPRGVMGYDNPSIAKNIYHPGTLEEAIKMIENKGNPITRIMNCDYDPKTNVYRRYTIPCSILEMQEFKPTYNYTPEEIFNALLKVYAKMKQHSLKKGRSKWEAERISDRIKLFLATQLFRD